MAYIFNSEKIKKLLSDFYLSTNVSVAFYDSNMNLVANLPEHTPYCKCVRNKKDCIKNCSLSNLSHMKDSVANHQMVSYTCHAGLMETIIPVTYEETLIGFMQIGQFRDESGKFSSEEMIKEVAKTYKINQTKLIKLYRNLPVLSEDKLQAVIQIMMILIKSFWDDSLITLNRSMLSVKVERYILEHLKEKLSVESICDYFFLSKNALYRLFNDEFNTTVGNFITNKRIHLAEKMLKETVTPVTQISAECGFVDYNYFIKAFKKQKGLPPLQFRKNSQQKND